MKLEQYLAQEGLTLSAFAGTVGTTHATISRIVAGKRHPSGSLMRRIWEVTDGAVTPGDFSKADNSASDLPASSPQEAA